MIFRKIKIELHEHCISLKREWVFGKCGELTYTGVIPVSIRLDR